MSRSDNKNRAVLFFFNRKEVQWALKTFGVETLKKSLCFSCSINAYETLTQLSIKIHYYENYFPKNRAEELHSIAEEWSKNWYKTAGMKLNRSDIDLIKTSELSLLNYFSKKLFQFSCIEQVFKKEGSSTVYLGTESTNLKEELFGGFEQISPVIKFLTGKKQIARVDIGKKWWSNKPTMAIRLLLYLLLLPKISLTKIKSTNADVLVVGHHYHLVNINNLISNLKKQDKKVLVVGKIGLAKNFLFKEKIDFLNLDRNIYIGDLPFIIKNKIVFLLKSKVSENYFRYDDYNLSNIFKPKLLSTLLVESLNSLVWTLMSREVFYNSKPKVLLCVSEDSSVQSFIETARSSKVLSVEIQHGFTVGSDSKYINADKLLVWGKVSRSIYQKTGVDSKKLIICGWPAFEIYKGVKFKKKVSSKKTQITFLAQDPEGVSLLFMNKTPEENLDIFFKAVSTLGFNTTVVVRLHPRADKTAPFTVAKKYKVKFRLSENERLNDLLSQADIVVGQTTSATLDAVIMHKPVIYLPSMRWPAKFVEGAGVAIEVNDVNSLRQAIKLAVDKGISKQMLTAQTKFVENYCNFPKDSNKLIAQTILGIIHGKP